MREIGGLHPPGRARELDDGAQRCPVPLPQHHVGHALEADHTHFNRVDVIRTRKDRANAAHWKIDVFDHRAGFDDDLLQVDVNLFEHRHDLRQILGG